MTNDQRELVKQAVKDAVHDEIVDHIIKGQSVVIWENDKVVHLSPEEAQRRLDQQEP